MESEYSEEEEFYFGNVAETRFTSSTANTTEGGDEVSLLNNQHPIGPSFVMKVAAGDTVKLSTRVYYESGQDYGTTVIPVNDLITALTGTLNPGALIGESAGTLMTDELSGLSGLAGGNNGDQAVPDAYLNNVLFDQDMNYLGAGFKSVEYAGISSNEHGTISETVVIQEDGYMLAYVSNESNSTDYVHFDDFTITHIKKREVRQINHYYPFGGTFNSYTSGTQNLYKYNGKEEQQETGWYDFGARMQDPWLGRFFTQDRFAEKYYDSNPYHYVMNNPINAVDINGDSTFVVTNDNGTYTVTGGNVDNPDDRGIYSMGEDGTYTQVGQSITSHSFFDDNGNPVKGAVIDPTSTEGQDFIDNEIVGGDPGLVDYMVNATGGEKYDLKTRGIDERSEGVTQTQFMYRGSAASDGSFGSARDFGNIGAGIVAARKGLSWPAARLGFDALESYQKGRPATEGIPTQKAQRVGFNIGLKLRPKNPPQPTYRRFGEY